MAEGQSVGGLTPATTSTSLGTPASSAGVNGAPSLTKTRPGVRTSMIGLELGEVLGDQRIGRRNRRIGHARDHRAEADQRMVDAVARQDRDRPLGVRPRSIRRLRDAARERCAPPRRSPCARRRPARSARKTRSGASRAQWSSQSVTSADRLERSGERTIIEPSAGARRPRPAARRSADFHARYPPQIVARAPKVLRCRLRRLRSR